MSNNAVPKSKEKGNLMSRLKNILQPSITVAATIAMTISLITAAASPASAEDQVKAKTGENTVRVMMKTTMGDIVLALDHAKAPITVDNFLRYADEGFYNGTIFHRIISNFMIQGGGLTADMEKKPTHEPIENEWQNGLKNKRGTIAMGRLGGQANSATSQFYINVVDNDPLDTPRDGSGYAVFGKVVEGMDVVDKIKNVKTGTKGMYRDVPVEPVVIEKVMRVDDQNQPIAPDKGENNDTKTGDE
jgi:cyclophilin family peptidyl-prolyl cis-trans isomerase